MADKKITRQLSIFINGKEVKNSLGGIGREIGKVKRLLREANDPTDIKKYKAELDNLNKKYGEVKKEVHGNISVLQKLKAQLGPVGIALASAFSIGAVVSYFKTITDNVSVLRNLKGEISQITDLEGEALDMVTSKVKSLSTVFEEDTKKMTEAANNLSKSMGIDFAEALNLIEKGYLDGANANGDFLDKVREYPALLKEAGLSAEQSISLMTQEIKQGIYSDKGVDAIKEANLRLREMTPAAQQALDAIGFSSKNIQEELKNGSKSTFDIIQEVSARLATLPPQSKVVGTAIADIFGGPGEDAGLAYLSNLHKIDLSTTNLTGTTNKYAEAKKLEIEANESLNNIWVKLTDTAGVLSVTWNKLKLQGARALEFLSDLIGISGEADSSTLQLRETISSIIKIIAVSATAFFSYSAALKLMSLWTKVATGDTILHTLAAKANSAGLVLGKGIVFAYQAAVALMSGNIKAATVAMRAFSIATKMNPLGALIGLITAAVAAYALFSKSTDEASRKQKALNDLKQRSASIYGEEEGALKRLLAVAKDENLSKEQRKKAIEELNQLSPKYLGNLTLENINTVGATEAINQHVKAMKQRAEQKALEQLIDETIKKRREEEAKGLEEHVSWYDYITASVKSFGNAAGTSYNLAVTAVQNKTEALKELSDTEKVYTEEYRKNLEEQSKADASVLANDKAFKEQRAALEKTANDLKIKNTENLTNEQLRVEIAAAIEKNNTIAGINAEAAEKAKEEEEKKIKSVNDLFDKSEEELTKLIKTQQQERLNNTKSEAVKEQDLIDQKYAELKEKYTLSEDEKTRLSIEKLQEREYLLKALEEEKALEKLEAKIARDAEFKELLDEIEEENRILDEEAKFERLEAEAENEDARALVLLEKTRAIALAQLKIEKDKELAKAKGLEDSEKLQQAIRDKYSKLEAKVDNEFTKGKNELEQKSIEKDKALNQQRLQNIANLFGGISQLLGEHTTAGKAAGIAQATINTYQGISEVWASKPESGLTGAGYIQKLVTSGLVLAQGLATVKKIASTKSTGFYYGGPTGDDAIGYDQFGKVTGVVHDNEWVAPKMMTENPRYANTFKWLESERLKTLGKGYYNGGFTSDPPLDVASPFSPTSNSSTEMSEVLKFLVKLDDSLNKGFRGYVVKDLEEFEKQKKLDSEYEQILSNTKL